MATLPGSDNPDSLVGTNSSDLILGAPGAAADPGAGGTLDNDTLSGVGGSDVIYGGGGNDILNGGEGYDSVYGGDGDDRIDAGPVGGANSGRELLDGGAGNDFLIINNKTDVVAGGIGSDTVDISAVGTSGWSFDSVTGTWTNPGTAGGDPVSISGVEWFQNGGTITTAPCFATGTRIATARGEVAVQDLRVGDLVVTTHGGAALQPVVWIGHSRVNVARQRAMAPILIKAGALAEGVPHRDLRVSPEHAMFLDGRLVPARLLVNGTGIVQEVWCPEVTYWHVELPAHGLLVAEGAVSESYFDDGNRQHFDNHAITTLFKDFASERGTGRYAEAACYPPLTDGPALERIQARLAARAGTPAGARRTA
jgi:hypothetical protein